MQPDSSDANRQTGEMPGSDALHLLDSMDVAAVLTGIDGRIRGVTTAFLKLGEYDLSELLRMRLQDVISGLVLDELSGDAVQKEMVGCLKADAAEMHSDDALCIVSKSGSLRWVHPHLSPVLDGEGRPVSRIFVMHDITPVRKARQAAEESDLNYRMLVEQANTVVMQVDVGFRICFINEYGARLFGYSREDLVGRSLLNTLVPPRDPDKEDLHAELHRIVAAPELHGEFDQHNRCSDGTWIWVHWAVRAVRNEAGDTEGLLCIGTDITLRKHAEIRAEWYLQRSRRLADELVRTEERERSRIAQDLHDQVVQMLSLANIRMGGIVHDLNQAGRAQETERLTEIRHLLEDAISACRSMMNELVPTLLYDVGLGAALKHLTRQEHLTHGITIHVADQLGKRTLSRRQSGLLFQSARELLMNALKYAGPCEIEICIRSAQDRVELVVSDNGRGFNAAAEDRPSDAASGGFGLFNIRERLAAFEGVLTVDSAPGRGTRATLSVPLEDG